MNTPVRVWVEVPATPLPESNVVARLQPIMFDRHLPDATIGHIVRLALALEEPSPASGQVPS